MLRIACLVFFALGMLSTGEAKAQLFLEDGKKTLAVSGGEHLNGYLLIHNTSNDQAQVRVYWEDFEYKPPYDGTKKFLPAGTSPASAGHWVTFSPQDFTMPAYGQQRIDYNVSVPDTIQEGHYGVLFFERSAEPLGGSQEGLTLVTRVGCLFFIEPKDKNKTAALENIALKGNDLTADFVDQGNVILIPHTTYYLMQNDGMVVFRGDAGKLYVPPGASAAMTVPVKEQLKPGNYTMVINSDLEEGDVVVKQVGLAVDVSGQITITSTE